MLYFPKVQMFALTQNVFCTIFYLDTHSCFNFTPCQTSINICEAFQLYQSADVFALWKLWPDKSSGKHKALHALIARLRNRQNIIWNNLCRNAIYIFSMRELPDFRATWLLHFADKHPHYVQNHHYTMHSLKDDIFDKPHIQLYI